MKLWIARDNNTKHEQLFGYYDEPHKEENYFVGNVCVIFNKELFPEVTFENSPMEAELKLVSNENN